MLCSRISGTASESDILALSIGCIAMDLVRCGRPHPQGAVRIRTDSEGIVSLCLWGVHGSTSLFVSLLRKIRTFLILAPHIQSLPRA